eukprot:832153-Pleurochrysis_carterae.AAC.1
MTRGGEPHPTDGEATRIVGYVDSSTRCQMYRHDEDAVQPENGGVARYDPAAAAERRGRWVAAAREALELEASGERHAHISFPEPCPSDSDEEETSGSCSDLEMTSRPDTPDSKPTEFVPTESTKGLSSVADLHRDADGSSAHTAVWPCVSIFANVVFLAAAITAGMYYAWSSDHGGRVSLAACLTAYLASALSCAIAVCTAASLAALAAPFCWFLMRWAHSPPQERKRGAPPEATLEKERIQQSW